MSRVTRFLEAIREPLEALFGSEEPKPTKPKKVVESEPEEPESLPQFSSSWIQKLRGEEPVAACAAIFGEEHPFVKPRPAKNALYAIAALLEGEKVNKTDLRPVAEALEVDATPEAILKRAKRRLEAAVQATLDQGENENEDDDSQENEKEEEDEEGEEVSDDESESSDNDDSDSDSDDDNDDSDDSGRGESEFSGELNDDHKPGPDEMFTPSEEVLEAANTILEDNFGKPGYFEDENELLVDMQENHWPYIPDSERKLYLKTIKKDPRAACARYISRGLSDDDLLEAVDMETPVTQTIGEGEVATLCCYLPIDIEDPDADEPIGKCFVCSTKYRIDPSSGSMSKIPAKPAKKSKK